MDRMFMERISFVSMPSFNVDSRQKACESLTVKSASEEIKDVLPRYSQEVGGGYCDVVLLLCRTKTGIAMVV